MESISARIYSHDSYNKDEKTNVIFELTNHSKKAVHVLKWNTPLEGLKSDCLDVRKNGKIVPYDGLMIKRGVPQPQDFIEIQPGQSVGEKVDLSEVYSLNSPGQVKVNYKPDALVVLKDQPTEESLVSFKANATKPLKVQTKQASFKIATGGKPRMTIGEKLRKAEPKRKTVSKKKAEAAITTFLPCVFNGGTTAQQVTVRLAHENGYNLTVATLSSMAKNTQYKTWFGTYTKTRFNKVKGDYQKIKGEFETKQFTYDLTGQGCQSGVYAYTYKGGSTIWLCDAFWMAPDTGTDSRAGTLVHEHSHASAFTDDLAYGQTACKQLAKKTPAKAINNADSHEYYSKG
ncbi:MAG: hypothetical protein C5B52_14560 [Bacteroidetes bacterium]|nr:MAG: hypothetical protein C5B52_14560 [Bacteroidota bacterium]